MCSMGRHVCRNWPELRRSQRQYIIEIYKFSSTPALEKRSGCCGGGGGSVAPLKRRARAERRLFLPF